MFAFKSMHDSEVKWNLAPSNFALGICDYVISQYSRLPDHHTYVVMHFVLLPVAQTYLSVPKEDHVPMGDKFSTSLPIEKQKDSMFICDEWEIHWTVTWRTFVPNKTF